MTCDYSCMEGYTPGASFGYMGVLAAATHQAPAEALRTLAQPLEQPVPLPATFPPQAARFSAWISSKTSARLCRKHRLHRYSDLDYSQCPEVGWQRWNSLELRLQSHNSRPFLDFPFMWQCELSCFLRCFQHFQDVDYRDAHCNVPRLRSRDHGRARSADGACVTTTTTEEMTTSTMEMNETTVMVADTSSAELQGQCLWRKGLANAAAKVCIPVERLGLFLVKP